MRRTEPVKFALFGAGSRGELDLGYFFLKHRKNIKYWAVAEPDDYRRNAFIEKFKIPKENAFRDWKELLEKPKLADAVIIALPCRMHHKSTIGALKAGYDVLLEKPMAHTAAECVHLARSAKKYKQKLSIVFENRYNKIYQKIKQMLNQNLIGRVMDITCAENIGYWHYIMSYVRGIHSRADEGNSFMIAKGIHDCDLISWLIESRAKRVASFGMLDFFNEDDAPQGSPERCTDDCPVQDTCIFDALKQYYEPGRPKMPWSLLKKQPILSSLRDMLRDPRYRTLASVVARDISKPNVLEVLKKSPHGKCVFHSENGVNSKQGSIIEFENDITCTFSLSAFSVIWERNLDLRGTKGEIISKDFTGHLEWRTYDPAKVKKKKVRYNGLHHGGGDGPMLLEFAKSIMSDDPDEKSMTDIENALEGHLIALAIDESNVTGKVIDMNDFRCRAEEEAKKLENKN